MYVLIIVIGVCLPGSVNCACRCNFSVVGKFENLDECKAARSSPDAAGPIADITVVTTWGANWYCTYSGSELTRLTDHGLHVRYP